MSDVSVLSSQYETLIETSDKVNHSIIALKKQHLLTNKKDKHYKMLKVSPQEIVEATTFIVHFLTDLSNLLKGVTGKSDDIPAMVVEDYVQKLQTNIPSVQTEVNEIVKAVKNKALESDHLQLMDKILMTLDSERKVLFRKLRSS